ncbi:MAG: hypothetical protein ACI4VF_07700 [Lachnospirales bacterium]
MRKIYKKPVIIVKRFQTVDNTNYITISANYGPASRIGRDGFDNDFSYEYLNK